MNKDIETLSEKIKKARGDSDAKDPQGPQTADGGEDNTRQGLQAGVELVVAIAVGTIIGYWLDVWLGTKPLFMIVMFFLGVGTGFYNVYRISEGMGTALGSFNRKTVLKNGLHPDEKDGKDK